MGENTKIEWCHHTFNPWRGCTKVSAGCANCYADRESKRNPGVLGVWGPQGTRVVASEAMWAQPRKWNREAREAGERRRVFCASLADVFEGPETMPGGSVEAVDGARRRLFKLIEECAHLDWLLLTKRPENMRRMWPQVGYPESGVPGTLGRYVSLPNAWIGTSVEDQETADERVPHLLQLRIPAARRFVSMEPLLGPVDLRYLQPGEPPVEVDALHGTHGVYRPHGGRNVKLDWVIVGGESGPHARPMHPDWARGLRDQCVAAGVPFFFKQWGEWAPPDQCADGTFESRPRVEAHAFSPLAPMGEPGPIVYRVGKQAAGRLLDGRTWDEVPG